MHYLGAFEVQVRSMSHCLNGRLDAIRPDLFPAQVTLCAKRISDLEVVLLKFAKYNPTPIQQEEALSIFRKKGFAFLDKTKYGELPAGEKLDQEIVQIYLDQVGKAERKKTTTEVLPAKAVLVPSLDSNMRPCYKTDYYYPREQLEAIFPQVTFDEQYQLEKLCAAMPLIERETQISSPTITAVQSPSSEAVPSRRQIEGFALQLDSSSDQSPSTTSPSHRRNISELSTQSEP